MTLEKAINDVRAELVRAVAKFPEWPSDVIHAATVVSEESGELAQAALQSVYEPEKSTLAEARAEAVQTAAMAIRFIVSCDSGDYARHELTGVVFLHPQTLGGELSRNGGDVE